MNKSTIIPTPTLTALQYRRGIADAVRAADLYMLTHEYDCAAPDFDAGWIMSDGTDDHDDVVCATIRIR